MNDARLVEFIGLLTHAFVLLLGLGGMLRIIPFPRGRWTGVGLILMALSMMLLVVAPRLASPMSGALVYAIGFVVALWLLLGPVPRAYRNSQRSGESM